MPGPVTFGVLLVGNVDPDHVDHVGAFGRTVAVPALGVGEAVHWAAACHLCPLPQPPQQAQQAQQQAQQPPQQAQQPQKGRPASASVGSQAPGQKK